MKSIIFFRVTKIVRFCKGLNFELNVEREDFNRER